MARRGQKMHWLSWVLMVGVGLATLAVTGANLVSSELSKTIFLAWVVGFAFVVWLCLAMSRGVLQWRWHWLDLGVLLWLVVNVVACLHSEIPRVSMWGFSDIYADGLVATLAFILLYILIINLPGRFSLRHWQWVMVGVSVLGSVGVLLTASLPWTVSLLARFSSQTAVTIALSVPLLLALRLSTKQVWEKWLSVVALGVNLAALILLDQDQGWWVLIISLAIWLIGLGWIEKKTKISHVLMISVFMVLGIFMLSVQLNTFQTDIFLSQQETWILLTQQFSHSWLGVGQNNFVVMSAAQNPHATAYITLASSSVLAWLVSLGVFGVAVWGSLVICLGWCLVRIWKKTPPSMEIWGVFCAWLSLVFAAFILPLGFTNTLLFWLGLAVLHRTVWTPAEWSFQAQRLVNSLGMLAIAASVLVLALSLWIGGRELVAQYHYWEGQKFYASQAPTAAVKTQLQAAQQLAPQQAEYNFALAELVLIQEQTTPQAQYTQAIQLIQNGLKFAPYQEQWKQIVDQLNQAEAN